MSSWIFIILILLGVVGFIAYRKHWFGKLARSKLSEQKRKGLIEKLEDEAAREKVEGDELRKVLEAKIELARTKAENIRLRKEIADTNETTVDRGGRGKPAVNR